jgi:seryl-tRNA synthetase
MDEIEIKEKLNTLADFHAHRDLIESDKRALLDNEQVPAEVEAVVKAGMKQMADVEMSFIPAITSNQEKIDAKLAAIVVPEEIKAALAEIDRKRAEVKAASDAYDAEIRAQIQAAKAKIQAEVEAQTKGVYDAIQQRRREIEAEFSGKKEAVDENIAALEKEIKDAIKAGGKSVKGDHFHAVYVSGRITWNTDKMEAWRQAYPFLDEARKEGEPSCTLKRI